MEDSRLILIDNAREIEFFICLDNEAHILILQGRSFLFMRVWG